MTFKQGKHPLIPDMLWFYSEEKNFEVLETVVKPWRDNVRGERPYVFQKDSAPYQSNDAYGRGSFDPGMETFTAEN